jgi:hypothetical protein
MPGIKYARIEISQEAYMALEVQAILQEKTLKRLASEMILKGAFQEGYEFCPGIYCFNHDCRYSKSFIVLSTAFAEKGLQFARHGSWIRLPS